MNQLLSIINKSINVGWAPASSPWEDWFLPTCCHSLHLQTSKAMQWGTPLLFLSIPVNQSQSISQLQSIIHSLHLQTSKAMRSTNHDWDKITMKMVSSGIFCRSWFLQSMPTLPLPSLGSRSWTTTTASYISFSYLFKFEIRQGPFSNLTSGKVHFQRNQARSNTPSSPSSSSSSSSSSTAGWASPSPSKTRGRASTRRTSRWWKK